MKTVVKYTVILFVLNCVMAVAAQDDLVPGSVIGRHIFGLATDVNGDPLLVNERSLIFDSNKFDRMLTVAERNYVISGFGDFLGGLYLTRYDAESKRYIDTVPFELAGIDGLSRPRGGVITPWESVVFGEAQLVNGADPRGFIDDFKGFYKGKAELVEPYNYGWVAEAIILDGEGSAKIIKNYAVGRVFASQLAMMPDGKSLYLFDRENTGLLYLYLADEANSLSQGVLYGISLEKGKLVYDLLGHSSALKMKLKLKKIAFDKLFDVAQVEDNGGCPEAFVHINTVYGEECIKVNKKNSKYAGLFEPVRMLAIQRKGLPLTKFSTVEFDQDNSRVKLASEGGLSTTYELGQSTTLDSRYIIQESQQ